MGLFAVAPAHAEGPVPLIPALQPPPVAASPVPPPAAIVAPAHPSSAPSTASTAGATTDWMATLGTLERQSVGRVLAARGYVVEPDPTGKVIGEVHIYNENVFAEKNRYLQFFNHFHHTTTEAAIAKELVIGKGEVWDQQRVEETARRLRDPLWTSVVAVIPVVAKDPAQVDLLVVTRDVWSLRLNTKYAFYADNKIKKLTNLTISLSENNFLGRRAVLAAGFAMDQSEVSTGPIFIDKNVAGEHLDLRVRANALYNRDALIQRGTLDREGSDSSISLSRPLWSLASKWGWGATFGHTYAVSRSFIGTNVRTYDNPDTPDVVEANPYVYQSKVIVGSASVTRQWGDNSLKQTLALGYEATSQRELPFKFDGDAAARAAFIRDVLPRTEVTSGPYISYGGFRARYRTLRNLSTYDLGEDARFGPDYSLSLSTGLKLLGGDADYVRGTASAGWTLPWCRDGFVRLSGTVSMRRQPGLDLGHKYIDNSSSTTLRVATPIRWHGRIVFQSQLSTRWNETQNRFYTIGSDSGLRGFVIDEFRGRRFFSTQIEARSIPIPIWVLRVGGVAFYELGGAANALDHLPLHQDVGVGFRALIPQTSRELFRFDFAFPLDGKQAGALRFLAGFESAF